MNFFEAELKKITTKVKLMKNPKLVGRACIACLTENITVKVEFAKEIVVDNYYGISVTLLNRIDGKIDTLVIDFTDLWGYDKFQEHIHVWIYGKPEWYAFYPTASHYTTIANAISDYLENFAD